MKTDESLVTAWQDGDARAGQQLLARYRRRLQQYFARRCPNHAEDLTQAVLLACVEGRDRFCGRSKYSTYVFTIAKRALAREIDKRRHDVEWTEDAAFTASIEHEVGLYDALASLPAPFREAIELYFYQGASGSEIAARLALSEGTVRSRVRRGVRDLRRHFAAALGPRRHRDGGSPPSRKRAARPERQRATPNCPVTMFEPAEAGPGLNGVSVTRA